MEKIKKLNGKNFNMMVITIHINKDDPLKIEDILVFKV